MRAPVPRYVGFMWAVLVAICEAVLLNGPAPCAFESPSTISGSDASIHQASTPRLNNRSSICDQYSARAPGLNAS